MGVRGLVARTAGRRVHVLVAEVAGGFLARVAVERELSARGWVAAQSPAEADVLAVCGTPTAALTERLEAVFDQLPGPRARADVRDPDDVGTALDTARERLRDVTAQHDDARDRVPADRRDMDHGDHGDMDHGDHGDMDHGDMDHGDHGDMEMAPAGIPLAEGAEDRDGLEMDVLHLPLGPVLPHWPAGLVVRCTLHGDVVTEAEVEQALGHRGEQAPSGADEAAALRLDAVASVLALAGWERGAERSRCARDLCLARGEAALEELAGLRRRLERARLLRWMLRGLGAVDRDDLPADVADRVGGDVHDRLLGLVDDAAALLRGETGTPYDATALLPELLAGLELASVRLVVASLGPFVAPVQEPAHA